MMNDKAVQIIMATREARRGPELIIRDAEPARAGEKAEADGRPE